MPPRIGTVVIPSDPYWVQALEAILHTNQKVGDDLILLQPAATVEDFYAIPPDDLVDLILAHELDALISTISSVEVLETLLDEGLPVISMTDIAFQHPLFTTMSSLYEGGYIAGQFIAEKLNGKGHTLCVTAALETIDTWGQSRLEGYCDAVKSYPGIETNHIKAYWSYYQSYPVLLETLKDYPHHIDAIFGVSDTIILSARDVARKLGIIDDQTILVGINGDSLALAAVAEGSLTATIDTASEMLGADAVLLAHKAALGEYLPGIIQQRFQLITSENVASIATRKLAAIADIPTQKVGYNRQQEQDRLSQLEISTEITRQIGSLLDRKQLGQVISGLVRQNYGYDWTRILRWSECDQTLTFYEGEHSPASANIAIEDDCLLNQVFRSNETIFIPDLRKSHRWQIESGWEPVRSRAILPIQLGTKVIGVLDLQSSQPVRQLSQEMIGLKLLAGQIGIGIQNCDLYLEALNAREVAERANQLKTRLVANVGHEMRTPLNAILGFSQAIQKKVAAGSLLEPEELDQDIRRIYQSGEHLMYMINDLLDLSRAEIGALNLYFEPLQPAPFLKEVFQNFSEDHSISPNLQWVLDVPDRLPVIRADLIRLRQVLINLLTNARKFTRQGTITLGAEAEPPYLHLWVRDTGQGVSPEIQEKIFEPFSTTGRKRRPEGIGLGLSISRHLVGLHNGIITLESQPGSGSTFHVYLPLPGLVEEIVSSPSPESKPVLVYISNSPHIPEDIEKICERKNLIPQRITARDDLNSILFDQIPCSIALDLTNISPHEWNLVQRLSANKKYAALPVMLYGVDEDNSQLSAGLTNVLYKPCGEYTLKDWIAQMDTGEGVEAPILVVDDDPDARAYYQELLGSSRPGIKVICAENGRQALEILKVETPSLIMLDLVMPELDGFAVLEKVRSDIRTQRVPVIIISGKLLTYEDVQRLNYHKTVFYTKGILSVDETVDLFRQANDVISSLPQPTSVLIKQVLAYLHQNYSLPISRKDISCAVGVSENYLSQIFREEITISPWDYLSRFRIQKSRELLLQTQDSVTQVAAQVGFNDPAYFSRVFRKLTGQSPQEFRQSRQ